MTSIKAVAEHAQVSIATVSRVLNGTKYVSPDVEKRVLEAIKLLNYQPNAPARNLRQQRTFSIGILLPQLNDIFFGAVAYELEKTFFARGYRPLFCSTENDPEKEAVTINNLIGYRVDGVVSTPAVPVHESLVNIKRILERNIPVVVVDRGIPDLNVSQIMSNHRQGGYDGADYLLRLGHRYIGIIDSMTASAQEVGFPGDERTTGIQQAMHDHGVPFDPKLVVIGHLTNIEMGFQGAMKLLREAPQVTAIFAMTDAIAVGVLRAASELGLKVPQDLSVVGFDDILLASHVIPRLTTVAQPVNKIAQMATDLLLRQIENPDAAPETVRLETQLVIRESTAPPSAEKLRKG
ncbi:MAG: LacI family DNA-binding transcriptional regulator [Anaerolineae bacterium]